MKVQVHFELRREDTAEILDTAEGAEPLWFVCGLREVFAGLDAGVLGMQVGETREMKLSGDSGWGERDNEKLGQIPSDKLPPGIQIGTKLQLQGPDGPMEARVYEIGETVTVLDFNHPLAGLPLTMKVTVVSFEEGQWVAQGQAVRPRKERLEKLAVKPATGPCAVCCKPAKLRCTTCKHVLYCSPSCAERHWEKLGHNETCNLKREDFQLDRVPPSAPPAVIDISTLSPDIFQAAFCEGEGKPVVIRGALRSTHLGSKWDLDSIVKEFGSDTPVQVRFYRGVALTPEVWTHAGYCDSTMTTASAFASLIRSGRASKEDAYVNCDLVGTPAEHSDAIQQLKTDLAQLAERTGLRPTTKLGEQINVWWGAPGHMEPLHSDTNDGTLLQIRGRKKAILFPASDWVNLYPFPTQAKMSWAWSRVSLQDVDVRSYPNVRKALDRRVEVLLEEGDALFIPACWAHQITGLKDNGQAADESSHVLSVNRFWKTNAERTIRWLPEDVGNIFRQTFPNGM